MCYTLISRLTACIRSGSIAVEFAAYTLTLTAQFITAQRTSVNRLCSVSSTAWSRAVAKGLSLYKSYSFRDKDPVIDEVRTLIQAEEFSYKDIHEASGVSVSTLYNWFEGTTKKPQYATVMAVVYALGYKSKFIRNR